MKTQVVVNPRGQIVAVSAAVPGSSHDLTLMVESQVLYVRSFADRNVFAKAK